MKMTNSGSADSAKSRRMVESIGREAQGQAELRDGETLIMIGPSIPLLTKHNTCISNGSNKNGGNRIVLPALMASASIVFEEDLANEGFNPEQPRLPAGKTGGGQWTSGGTGGEADRKLQSQTVPSVAVLSGGDTRVTAQHIDQEKLGAASTTKVSSDKSRLFSDQFGSRDIGQSAAGTGSKTGDPQENRVQSGAGESGGSGEGTISQLEDARQELDDAYAKEVGDIKSMSGISEKDRNAGLKSLQEKYTKARGDYDRRIAKLDQLSEDIAFVYGGKASDYAAVLDDTDPKLQELMGLLDHFDSFGVKDAFLLTLRTAQGGAPPPPNDPHVLRAALFAGISAATMGEGSRAEKVVFEELSAKAKKAAQLLKNFWEGFRRELKTAEELAAENPGKAIQRQLFLRDASGKRVLDPITGKGRVVDHAVIDREANIAKTYETTGENVDKSMQMRKEKRVRDAGGTFVQDKATGKLIPVEGVSEIRGQK